MGEVWVAHHAARNCEVAVKLVLGDERTDAMPLGRERFAREAEIAMKLRSPHVIHTFEYGETDAGQPYLVMERLHGQSLEERIAETGPLSLADVARLVEQTGSALSAAHALSLIHRDIKPDNIFIEAGRPTLYVKVLDFGIAKDTAMAKGASLTATGFMVGSPYFMAPEQMENAKVVDARADNYALGAVIYYALTGELPFVGDTPVEVWNAKKARDYMAVSQRLSGCPVALDQWFDKALASAPTERFATVSEMAASFANAAGLPTSQGPRNIRTGTEPLSDPNATNFPPQTRAPSGARASIRDTGTTPLDDGPPYAPAVAPTKAAATPPPNSPTVPGTPLRSLRTAGMTQPAGAPDGAATPARPTLSGVPAVVPAPSRSVRKGLGAGKLVGIGMALLVATGTGAGLYWTMRPAPATLESCKETEPRKCADVGIELLGEDHKREAFKYLAVAALRDSRLGRARDSLASLKSLAFEAAELTPLQEACDQDDPLACYLHAQMKHSRFKRPALRYLRERCEDNKDMAACAELGAVHDDGRWGVKANAKEAANFHRIACDGGNTRGCVSLGRLMLDGRAGLKRDPTRAVQHFKSACDKKDMDGCVALGRAFAQATGDLDRDFDKAAELFERSCRGDDLQGCWELGGAFARARGRDRDHKRAVKLFERACAGGVMPACTDWGRMHERGRGGLTRDPDRAIALYRQACDAQDAAACVELGLAYESAKGTLGKDEEKAVALYQRACDAELMEGCRTLANACAGGMGGLEKDLFRAFELNRRACKGGNLSACVNVGYYHSQGIGGAEQDHARARNLYETACEGGESRGCSNLGAMYAHGEGGLDKNMKRALELFEKACEDGYGDLSACANMGVMHAQGKGGLDKDVARAAEIYSSACDKGGQMACVNLGGLLRRGDAPIKRDQARAARLYEAACRRNYALGCTQLGWLFEKGWGVPRDEEKAVDLHRQACTAGNATGCASLASMYERGRGGLKRSRDRARELYRQACDGGSSFACTKVKRLR